LHFHTAEGLCIVQQMHDKFAFAHGLPRLTTHLAALTF
jgi:hypothetical protein